MILTEDVYGWLYYFSGFAGYFLLGYYIKRFKPTLSLLTIMALYLVPFVIASVSKFAGIEILYHSYSYLSLMVVMMCLGIFLFVLKVAFPSCSEDSILTRAVVSFSNCSFGIYLVHIFVMRSVVWDWIFVSSYGGAFQIVCTTLFTVLISWLFVVSYLPCSEYIIGYKHK